MANDTQFKPRQSGNPATKFKPGNPHRWQGGASGNPTGKSRYRAQFEALFNEALVSQGSPEEAAALLWAAARAKEAWAIQNICARFAPQTQNLHLSQEVNNDQLDYSKLSDEQLEQLEKLLEQTGDQPDAVDRRKGTAATP